MLSFYSIILFESPPNIEIDDFFSAHNFSKKINPFISSHFYRWTKDFITEKESPYYTVSPYHLSAESSPPYAIGKIKINDNITAVFYAYIKISELLIPSVELQTFDNQGNNIDNLVVYYYVNECNGYRKFCIDEKLNLNIDTYFYCAGSKDEAAFKFKKKSVFKIDEKGKFLRVQ